MSSSSSQGQVTPDVGFAAAASPQGGPTSFIAFLYRTAKVKFVASIALAILAGALDVGNLTLIGEGIRRQRFAWYFVALFIFTALTTVAVKTGSRLILANVVYTSVINLRMQITRRILATPLQRIEQLGAASILSVVAEDVQTLAQTVWTLPELYVNLAVLTGGSIYVALISPGTLLAVFCCAGIAFVVGARVRSRSLAITSKVRAVSDVLFGHFRALTDGFKELQLQNQRKKVFCDSMLKTSTEQRTYGVAAVRATAPSFYASPLLISAVVGSIIFLSPLDLAHKSACVFAVLMIGAPIAQLGNIFPSISRTNQIFRRIDTLGLAPASAAELVAHDDTAPPASWQTIKLCRATHKYRNDYEDKTFSLGPIDIECRRGEIVFIVGGNGSGKTTLAKLIMGLYAPDSGSIELDGVQVTDALLPRYRQLFSATFSDSYIFESILPAGDGSTSSDEVCAQLLKKMQLDHKVTVKNGIFSTIALSQGQRKRLALVSVYMEGRSFLVFDEWAADQDPNFKNIFYHTLLPELKARGKTILAITHDDRYYSIADRILTVENGQIISSVVPQVAAIS